MTKIAVFLLVAQTANAASINYTFELDATLTLDGTPTVQAVPIIISGTGDTDNIFSIDATRIANAFDATIDFGGSSYSFAEPVYVVRAGGTLAFAADISGLNIATVLSANTVPVSYGLDTDAAFDLTPAVTFGSFDTNGGLLTFDAFAPNSMVRYESSPFPTPVAPVPLPAASLLLISAIGGLGALSRRRKA